jgi:uncharacterized protein YidB (DUF937 family)
MQNGPRGQRQPTSPSSSGGMSPMMMALLALLAYKALKGRSQAQAGPAAPPRAPQLPPGTQTAGNSPGGGLSDILGGLFKGHAAGAPGRGLDDMLRGGLGGLLGGAAAGSVLSGGLGNLVKELQERGDGDVANSWVGPGQNQDIAPRDLEHALGSDAIDTLTRQTGISRDELLSGLSDYLPDLVDQLTPQGRLPTEQEASTMV